MKLWTIDRPNFTTMKNGQPLRFAELEASMSQSYASFILFAVVGWGLLFSASLRLIAWIARLAVFAALLSWCVYADAQIATLAAGLVSGIAGHGLMLLITRQRRMT
jgi:hypothetical protein